MIDSLQGLNIDILPKSPEFRTVDEYTIFWTREQLMEYIENRRSWKTAPVKIRRQKPKPPRRIMK